MADRAAARAPQAPGSAGADGEYRWFIKMKQPAPQSKMWIGPGGGVWVCLPPTKTWCEPGGDVWVRIAFMNQAQWAGDKGEGKGKSKGKGEGKENAGAEGGEGVEEVEGGEGAKDDEEAEGG